MAALIQATLMPVLAPIVAPLLAEQAALRQIVERQADQLVGQAETIGRQGAELATAEAFRRRKSRRLTITIALVMAATLAIVGMLAPAWVR